MSDAVPIGSLQDYPQTDLPVVSDATLVDDSTALVDDTMALVGGTAAIAVAARTKTNTIVPRPAMVIRR